MEQKKELKKKAKQYAVWWINLMNLLKIKMLDTGESETYLEKCQMKI